MSQRSSLALAITLFNDQPHVDLNSCPTLDEVELALALMYGTLSTCPRPVTDVAGLFLPMIVSMAWLREDVSFTPVAPVALLL